MSATRNWRAGPGVRLVLRLRAATLRRAELEAVALRPFLILAAGAVLIIGLASLLVILLIITWPWLALAFVFWAGFGAGLVTAIVLAERTVLLVTRTD